LRYVDDTNVGKMGEPVARIGCSKAEC